MSKTSGDKKDTLLTQAVQGPRMQPSTQSDSQQQDTTFGRGPDGLLVQILAADKVETDPQAPDRQSRLPAGSRGSDTPCQDT